MASTSTVSRAARLKPVPLVRELPFLWADGTLKRKAALARLRAQRRLLGRGAVWQDDLRFDVAKLREEIEHEVLLFAVERDAARFTLIFADTRDYADTFTAQVAA